MKKQKGFTLIELLLAVAIVGILTMMATSSFIGLRARTRDRAAMNNMVGRISDLQAQYDRLRDFGEYTDAEIAAALGQYLKDTSSEKDKNPWVGTDNATVSVFDFEVAVTSGGAKTVSEFEKETLSTFGTVLGQPKFAIQFATLEDPGFLGGVVLLQAKDRDKKRTKIYKTIAIE